MVRKRRQETEAQSVDPSERYRYGGTSSSKPSTSSTSAEPDEDETARFPVLRERGSRRCCDERGRGRDPLPPVCAPSPPVPAVSTRSPRSGRTGTTCARIASANPAISSAVSRLSAGARSGTRRGSCACVASPRITLSMTARARGTVERAAVQNFREGIDDQLPLSRKFFASFEPGRRQHRLRVELHTVDGKFPVSHSP